MSQQTPEEIAQSLYDEFVPQHAGFVNPQFVDVRALCRRAAAMNLDMARAVLARHREERVTCPECKGTGQFDEIQDSIKCDTCGGSGSIPATEQK